MMVALVGYPDNKGRNHHQLTLFSAQRPPQ